MAKLKHKMSVKPKVVYQLILLKETKRNGTTFAALTVELTAKTLITSFEVG